MNNQRKPEIPKTITIDIEKLTKYLPFSEREILEHTLRKVIEINEFAERNYRKDVYNNNQQIKDQFQKLFRPYYWFCDLFGQEYVDRYLLRYTLEEISEVKGYRKHGPIPWCPYPSNSYYLYDKYQDMVVWPNRTRKTKELCAFYRVPKEYQGLIHGELIINILSDKYPWTDGFNINAYEISPGHDWIYVNNNDGKTALYVPVSAFVKGDVEGIKRCAESNKDLASTPTALAFLELVKTIH